MLDFIFEFFIEVILESTLEGLMTLFYKIVPQDKVSPKFEKIIKIVVAILSAIMAGMLFFGVIIRLFAETYEDKRIANILLIISGSYVAVLVVIRIFTPHKKK
ncbi:MAG: hypothetical protein ACI4KI_01925 [Candidatus Fimenecus sp.]